MSGSPDNDIDPELRELVEAFLDQRLDAGDKARLEQRLRDDPAAREYCARALRFDSALQESLQPQKVEWLETRRVRMTNESGVPAWEIQRNQSVRYGDHPDALPPIVGPKRWRWTWIALPLALVTLATGMMVWNRSKREPASPGTTGLSPVLLRNGDFEATDLTYAASDSNSALVDWQDYFTTGQADLCEISRATRGTVLPKSGRNVARLWNYAYLTQRLTHRDGSPVRAKPGMRLAVSGWAYVLQGSPPYGMRGALRFVASGKPGMIQYEAAHGQVSFVKDGWQRFRLEIALPGNLEVAASDIDAGIHSPAKLDLSGKELTLSLDSRCSDGCLLLDALEIGEVPAEAR